MRHQINCVLLVGLAATAPAWSVPPDPAVHEDELRTHDIDARTRLQARLKQITADPEARDDAMYFGELRSTLCKTCHGADGNSVREGTPNLAGQNPVYIVDQFQRYADGRRQDFWMASLAKHFTEDDKLRLAVFYARQTTKPAGGGDLALHEQGKTLYQQLCSECHGADAKSSEGYAHLAGQRPEYTIKMLKEFQTAGGKRFNPWMYARANMLKTDQEIQAIATYLANLN